MPDPDLRDVIIEVLRQEGRPVPLFVLIDALKSEGYAQEDVEQALSELEKKGYVKKGRTRTLFGEEETVELIREPEEVAKLTEFVEEEKVELTSSEQRTLEALKRAFGVEEPEITEVDGTKTVIVEYRGEKINIAIGEVKKPELFEPLSLEGKIWYAKKSPALERLKRKLKGVEEKEIRRPTAGVTEYGALERFGEKEEKEELEIYNWRVYAYWKPDRQIWELYMPVRRPINAGTVSKAFEWRFSSLDEINEFLRKGETEVETRDWGKVKVKWTPFELKPKVPLGYEIGDIIVDQIFFNVDDTNKYRFYHRKKKSARWVAEDEVDRVMEMLRREYEVAPLYEQAKEAIEFLKAMQKRR